MMGELSAVQALTRKLRPGETREAIVKRVQDGLNKDFENKMNLPAPLNLALSHRIGPLAATATAATASAA
eukprot:11204071-Lingulodinium_polyedra.AAC.1